ncbi:MAG: undecaprenyl-diphosphate phosphatase [Alphaproteobacteria bacterium]|nr:undecaprenyl-diphosphate phosphatase [Alphaproteobacteria bacterium]
MPILHVLVLAAVQGITEFLPISSSGHLILVPTVTGWPDQGLTIDVAVHVGTLGAVAVYLWRDLLEILRSLWQLLRGRVTAGARLFGYLVVATIPVVIAGYFANDRLGGISRNPEVIAWAMIGFGIVLYLADRLFLTVKRMDHLNLGAAITVGLAQVLALIPGTSRAGITMTAARMLGYERTAAARFSMLLSIPTILGAGALKGFELSQSGDIALGRDALLSGGFAFGFALIAILLMMSWLRRASFTPFVVYRLLIGGILLAWIHGWIEGLPFPIG